MWAGTINHVLAHIDTHLDHDLREADLAALCGRSACGRGTAG
jgi:hypothetical protein